MVADVPAGIVFHAQRVLVGTPVGVVVDQALAATQQAQEVDYIGRLRLGLAQALPV
jgi:hypothetical protein